MVTRLTKKAIADQQKRTGRGTISPTSLLLTAVSAALLLIGSNRGGGQTEFTGFTTLMGMSAAQAAQVPEAPIGNTGPVQVSLTLSDQSIVAGQPVTAIVTITNVSKEPMTGPEFVTGDTSEWLRFSLKDESGTEVRPDPRPRTRFGLDLSPPEPGSTISSNNGGSLLIGSLASGATYKAQVLLSHWKPVTPGQYLLEVRAELGTRPDLWKGPRARSGAPASSELAASARVPLTVKEADRAVLWSIAYQLRDAILDPKANSGTSMDALLSLPASVAQPVWRSLAMNPKLSPGGKETFSALLARQGSINAAGIIGEMWMRESSPNGSPELARSFRLALEAIRNRSSDNRVDKYVDGLIGPVKK